MATVLDRGAQSREEGLLVLRGEPTDEELAALVAVLALLGTRRAQAAPDPRLRRRHRAPVSWRARR